MIRVYCINLDHRTDRWSQAQANYAAQGLGGGAVQRWSAVADPEFGELGCAKSHLAVLSHFLTQTDDKFCVMLEDDFRFLRPFSELTAAIVDLSRQGVAWDVLLLAGTDVMPYPENPPGLARVAESSTTSGYLVSRAYAHKLIACFAEAVTLLEPYRPIRPRQGYTIRLAVDQAWKRLQGVDRWLIFTKAFGHQQPSYSDIVRRNTDYSHVEFGVARAAST